MLDEQYQRYLDDVEKAARDCAAAVRRLVTKGPPMYINDAHGMPLPEGDTHIAQLWFADDDSEISAFLKVRMKTAALLVSEVDEAFLAGCTTGRGAGEIVEFAERCENSISCGCRFLLPS
jgi:hypothetical protein